MAEHKVYFSTASYFVCMLLVMLLPFRWMCAAAAAIGFHECSHYFAIRILSDHAPNVRFYTFGARIPLPQMSRGRELVCALAGPVGGIALIALFPFFPRLAVCAAVQSAYNLLPIYPLDGGRALSCALAMITAPPRADQISRIVAMITRCLLTIVGLYTAIYTPIGMPALLITAIALIRTK